MHAALKCVEIREGEIFELIFSLMQTNLARMIRTKMAQMSMPSSKTG